MNYCHGDMDINAFICRNRVVLHHHAIVCSIKNLNLMYAELMVKSANFLVAGDFNCELPEMYYNGFTTLHYNPIIWRAGKSCIDHFAHKNYSESTKIVVNDVSANLVLPLEHCPVRGTNDSILEQIGTMSDHDPVRATMTVTLLPLTLSIPQTLSISCCNMNFVQNAADYLAKGIIHLTLLSCTMLMN